MKAILLCAGYATRLYPLTEHQPKSLLPLGGRPMMNYLVDQVMNMQEMSGIFVVSNAKFFEAFGRWKKEFYEPFPIDILNDGSTDNDNRLGAIRDLVFVLRERNLSDDCLILAADNFFDFKLVPFTEKAKTHRPWVSVAVYDVNHRTLAKKYGLVKHDATFQITEFVEKPAEPKTTLASTGVYFFPKESLPLVPRYLEHHQNPDAPGNYIQWLVAESKVFAFPFQGTWYDIGDFDSYRKADQAVRGVRND